MILLLLLFILFNGIMCQDDIRPEDFGYYYVHSPQRFTPEIKVILDDVVNSFISYNHYNNITITCPPVHNITCPPISTCPPPIIMDSTDYPTPTLGNNPEDAFGFLLSILLITLINLGLLGFAIYQGYEMMKTKINPFRVRVDPVTE